MSADIAVLTARLDALDAAQSARHAIVMRKLDELSGDISGASSDVEMLRRDFGWAVGIYAHPPAEDD